MEPDETSDYLESVLDAYYNLKGNWYDTYGCTGEGLPKELFADLETVLSYAHKSALRDKRLDLVRKVRARVDEVMNMVKSQPKQPAPEWSRRSWWFW